ncbi:MAG: glycosyltransferase family 2 protein [Burkholderiales bacterium]|nr:glycosyltransferase family 2 protein [Burkholderiales bacterium]MBK8665986.1 glycosyltransferase family 2 protein [Burkholderiales bacterium]
MLLSVIAPCRNEAAYITPFCDSVAAQRLPPGVALEVLIADGESDDGTRERLAEFCARDARFRWLGNPGRIVSSGLNRCIEQARGEVIARLDIHSTYAPDYLAECLAALERSGADNVGGPWVAEGHTPMQRAIARAFQSRWVVGGARSRDRAYEGEVDTVYLGCWPRASFERFGGFDEQLVRNQDDEHNLRIRTAGGRIWQSARIRSAYSPRGSLRHLFHQQRQYGYWRPFVMRKHGQPGSPRQLVPALFVAALLGGALLLPWAAWPLMAVLLAYSAYLALASTLAARQGAADARVAGAWWRLPVVIATYHVGYGLGSWAGLADLLGGRRVSGASAKISR